MHYPKETSIVCYLNHLFLFSLIVGSQQDMIVNVWDWHNNIKVASNKISTKVKAISFAENGNYFVTGKNNIVSMYFQKKPSSNQSTNHIFFTFQLEIVILNFGIWNIQDLNTRSLYL